MGDPNASVPIDVVWLCGAPGVGKSATGWRIVEQSAGRPTAYVDIDQVGILWPPPEGDAERTGLKAAALAALVGPLQEAGVEMLVVSGVVDAWTPQRLTGLLGDRARIRFALLTTERAEHHDRLAARGGRPEDVERSILEQRRILLAPFPRTRVDTTRRSVEQVAAAVLAGTDDGPLDLDPSYVGPPTPPTPDVVAVPAPDPTWAPGRIPVPITVWTGVRAVGKSSVSMAAAPAIRRDQGPVAYLDLAQLGFVHPAPLVRDRLLDVVAAVAQVHAAAGAVRLLLNGTVDATLATALRERAAPHPVEVVGLRADPDVLRGRVAARARGSNPGRLAGDDLAGLDESAQARVVAEGLAQQERWDAAPFEDRTEQVVDGLPPGVATRSVRRRWWRRR